MDSLISCCGLDCSKCHLYKNMCEGCNACHGKVFHAPKGLACPIYECAVNKNGFESCTNCKDLPCLIWKTQEILPYLIKNLKRAFFRGP